MLKTDSPKGENGMRKDFRLEDWLVQPQLNRVTRGPETVQVQPKIMAVLVCLAEEPGTVVAREQLFKAVWAETYVTDHVLARAVSVLRKIFDDSPKSPRVIETIPKVGYRLIAPVLEPTVAEKQDTTPETEAWAPFQQPQFSPPAVVENWLSPRLLTLAVGLLGLLFFVWFFMSTVGTGHRHLHQ